MIVWDDGGYADKIKKAADLAEELAEKAEAE